MRIWKYLRRQRPPDAHLFRNYGDLDLAGFREHPAWIYVHIHDFGNPLYEDTDEEAMRPWDQSYPVPETASCEFLSEFETASGLRLEGAITRWAPIEPDSRPEIDHAPRVFLRTGDEISFWHGVVRQGIEEAKSVFYSTLELSENEAFPMTYSVSPKVAHGGIEGTIPGFGFFDEDNGVKFVK